MTALRQIKKSFELMRVHIALRHFPINFLMWFVKATVDSTFAPQDIVLLVLDSDDYYSKNDSSANPQSHLLNHEGQ